MITRNDVMRIVRNLVGHENIVGIPKLFAKMLGGDWTAAAMLNQIIFWSGHTDDPNGWLYKTNKEWQDELYITRHQVAHCIKLLACVGVQTMVYKVGDTPKTHFYVDEDKFMAALQGTIAGDFRLPLKRKSDFTKNGSRTSVKTEDSLRHRSRKTEDHKESSAPAAGSKTKPARTKKKNSAAQQTSPAAREKSHKREVDPILNAIARFCYKAETQADMNVHMGHIGKDGAKPELLEYLVSLAPTISDEQLTTIVVPKVVSTIMDGEMGKWWDDNHKDQSGRSLERPASDKFVATYVAFRRWRIGQLDQKAEVDKPKVNYVDWIEDDNGVERPWVRGVDRLPITYKRNWGAPEPEQNHA